MGGFPLLGKFLGLFDLLRRHLGGNLWQHVFNIAFHATAPVQLLEQKSNHIL